MQQRNILPRWLLAGALLLAPPLAVAGVESDASAQAQIDRLVDETVARYDLPGIAVGVIEGGEVIHVATRGRLAVDGPAAVDADSLFKIASNTKAMTGALLARLVQAGKLRWDDPVIRHLPQFRMHDPWVTQQIQVRDLLLHNSGLGLGAGDLMLWPEPNDFSRADIIAGLAHLKPVTSFRAGYAYDNLLYVVAGEVAAAAGGKPYNQLLREEVFAPLGLEGCRAGDWSPGRTGNVAQPHVRREGRNVVGGRDGDWEADFPSMAAGGVRCSLTDMLRWSQVLLDPELVPGWLDTKQRRALWTAHMPMPISERMRQWEGTHFLGYGYGWRISDMEGQWKVAHTGTLSGMYSSLALLPDRRNGVVILINGEAEDARIALMQVLLKRWTQPQVRFSVGDYGDRLQADREASQSAGRVAPDTSARQPATPAGVSQWAGVYRDPWFGEVMLCPQKGAVRWVSRKSPRLDGQVMRLDSRWLVQWERLGEDAEAWLQFSHEDGKRVMQMRAIDPDIDFSYDYQNLHFVRTGACPASGAGP